ncbi:SDR family oxidoreductase [Chloroflexota bacterium]
MAGQLENKVALVTGASSGIGRASALKFAREGAKVVIVDVLAEAGEETVNMIKKAGSDAIFVKTDVTKASEVEAMVKKTVETYGRLDCAFNNAGVPPTRRPITETTEEDWDRIIGINLKGVWLCLKYEIQQMLKQGKGSIVNTASVFGLVGQAKRSLYDASKHGVIGLTRVTALECATAGIRVNAVCPSVVSTPMVQGLLNSDPKGGAQLIATVPIERLGTPEEIAEAAAWLCSEASSFVTGHAMAVDGGYIAK